ncbi:hypothetical protein [Nocardiopsis sp. NPDC006938]|uniref:hypothetical protein n=1 Tax=Nocardiopsis sp. NPDC006938 TaxID=3364337 RepID=UPI0036C4745D
MPSPSGSPHPTATRLAVAAGMAAVLGQSLWFTLTTGHPLREGSAFHLLALVLVVLCVLGAAALPRRPGAGEGLPPLLVWSAWPLAAVSTLVVLSEPGLLPWLWPILPLPLSALALVLLATLAHVRPSRARLAPRRSSPSQSLSVGATGLALVSLVLYVVLTNTGLSRTWFVLLLLVLVAVLLVAGVLQTVVPLPSDRSDARTGPPTASGPLVGVSWAMSVVSALPFALVLAGSGDPRVWWPLGLFPLAALALAALGHRAHLRERVGAPAPLPRNEVR